MKKYLLIILVGLLAFATPVHADTFELNGIQYTGTHISRFTGHIYYVDASQSDDSGNGISPHNAKKTIGAAIAAASAGDAITIKAGTYDEDGLDVNLDGLELWGEIGVLLTNGTPGTVLTISANTCRIKNIVVQQAGQIGFDVNGNGNTFEDCVGSTNSIAYDIDGIKNTFLHCKDQNATTTGFDVATESNDFHQCSSIATGGASRGFYLSNAAADENLFSDCISTGNTIAGFETVSNTENNVFVSCSSGGQDGLRVDAGIDNVWSGFVYDDNIYYTLTFPVTAGSENLYEIFGSVNIKFIYGDVSEAIHADVNDLKLELYDGGATDITNNVDTSSAPIGSLFMKTKTLGEIMSLDEAGSATLNEDSIGKKGAFEFVITAKNTGNTYIRATWTGAAGAGVTGIIHWHCQWEPLTENGNVTAP